MPHDWHAGLTPAQLRRARAGRLANVGVYRAQPGVLGMFYLAYGMDIELPWSFYNRRPASSLTGRSCFRAGLYYADHITAVSPTYAREITEPQYAHGMEGCCASAIMKVGCREFPERR